jgi:hypothetical protein
MGVQAGQSNTTGSSNLMMGVNAGAANTTGSANFFVGDNAGGNNTTGGYYAYLGTNAGNGRGVNGDNNVSIGANPAMATMTVSTIRFWVSGPMRQLSVFPMRRSARKYDHRPLCQTVFRKPT